MALIDALKLEIGVVLTVDDSQIKEKLSAVNQNIAGSFSSIEEAAKKAKKTLQGTLSSVSEAMLNVRIPDIKTGEIKAKLTTFAKAVSSLDFSKIGLRKEINVEQLRNTIGGLDFAVGALATIVHSMRNIRDVLNAFDSAGLATTSEIIKKQTPKFFAFAIAFKNISEAMKLFGQAVSGVKPSLHFLAGAGDNAYGMFVDAAKSFNKFADGFEAFASGVNLAVRKIASAPSVKTPFQVIDAVRRIIARLVDNISDVSLFLDNLSTSVHELNIGSSKIRGVARNLSDMLYEITDSLAFISSILTKKTIKDAEKHVKKVYRLGLIFEMMHGAIQEVAKIANIGGFSISVDFSSLQTFFFRSSMFIKNLDKMAFGMDVETLKRIKVKLATIGITLMHIRLFLQKNAPLAMEVDQLSENSKKFKVGAFVSVLRKIARISEEVSKIKEVEGFSSSVFRRITGFSKGFQKIASSFNNLAGKEGINIPSIKRIGRYFKLIRMLFRQISLLEPPPANTMLHSVATAKAIRVLTKVFQSGSLSKVSKDDIRSLLGFVKAIRKLYIELSKIEVSKAKTNEFQKLAQVFVFKKEVITGLEKSKSILSSLKGVVVKLSRVDASSAVKQLERLAPVIERISKSSRGKEVSIKISVTTKGKIESIAEASGKGARNAAKQADNLDKAQSTLSRIIGSFGKYISKEKESNKQHKKTRKELFGISKLSKSISVVWGFIRKINPFRRAEKGARGLRAAIIGSLAASGIIIRMIRSLKDAGRAILSQFSDAFNKTLEFEEALNVLGRKASLSMKAMNLDNPRSQLSMIGEEIKKINEEFPVFLSDITKVAVAGKILGIQLQRLPKFIRLVTKFSLSSNLALEQSALQLGRLSNVLGERFPNDAERSADSLQFLGSAIVAVAKTIAGFESDVINVAMRAGFALRDLGFSSEAVIGLAAGLKDVGITSEVAGTNLAKVAQRVLQLKTFLKVAAFLRKNPLELQLEFETARRMGRVEDFFLTLIKRIKDTSINIRTGKFDVFEFNKRMKALAGSSIRAQMVLRGIANNIDKMREKIAIARKERGIIETVQYFRKVKKEAAAAGNVIQFVFAAAMEDAFRKQSALNKEYELSKLSLKKLVDRAKSLVENIKVDFISVFRPQIKVVIMFFVQLLEFIKELPRGFKQVASAIGIIAGAVLVLSSAQLTFNLFLLAIKSLGTTFTSLATTLVGIALTPHMLLLYAAIAGVVTIVYTWFRATQQSGKGIRDTILAITDYFKKFALVVKDKVISAFKRFNEFIDRNSDSILAIGSSILSFFNSVWNMAKAVLVPLGSIIVKIFLAVADKVTDVISLIGQLDFSPVLKALDEIKKSDFGVFIQDTVQGAIDSIKSLFSTVQGSALDPTAINNFIKSISESIAGFFKGIDRSTLELIKIEFVGMLKDIWGIVVDIFKIIGNVVPVNTLIRALKVVGVILVGIAVFIRYAFRLLKIITGWVAEITKNLKAQGGLYDKISGILQDVFYYIFRAYDILVDWWNQTTALEKAWTAVKAVFYPFIGWMMDGAKWLWKWVGASDKFSKVWNGMKDLMKSIWGWLKKIIDGVRSLLGLASKKGIKTAATKVTKIGIEKTLKSTGAVVTEGGAAKIASKATSFITGDIKQIAEFIKLKKALLQAEQKLKTIQNKGLQETIQLKTELVSLSKNLANVRNVVVQYPERFGKRTEKGMQKYIDRISERINKGIARTVRQIASDLLKLADVQRKASRDRIAQVSTFNELKNANSVYISSLNNIKNQVLELSKYDRFLPKGERVRDLLKKISIVESEVRKTTGEQAVKIANAIIDGISRSLREELVLNRVVLSGRELDIRKIGGNIAMIDKAIKKHARQLSDLNRIRSEIISLEKVIGVENKRLLLQKINLEKREIQEKIKNLRTLLLSQRAAMQLSVELRKILFAITKAGGSEKEFERLSVLRSVLLGKLNKDIINLQLAFSKSTKSIMLGIKNLGRASVASKIARTLGIAGTSTELAKFLIKGKSTGALEQQIVNLRKLNQEFIFQESILRKITKINEAGLKGRQLEILRRQKDLARTNLKSITEIQKAVLLRYARAIKIGFGIDLVEKIREAFSDDVLTIKELNSIIDAFYEAINKKPRKVSFAPNIILPKPFVPTSVPTAFPEAKPTIKEAAPFIVGTPKIVAVERMKSAEGNMNVNVEFGDIGEKIAAALQEGEQATTITIPIVLDGKLIEEYVIKTEKERRNRAGLESFSPLGFNHV